MIAPDSTPPDQPVEVAVVGSNPIGVATATFPHPDLNGSWDRLSRPGSLVEQRFCSGRGLTDSIVDPSAQISASDAGKLTGLLPRRIVPGGCQ